ncbi:MAG: hypothetical protein IJC39_00585, partial [Firmicutes bacterium]|nr:hypothetical protein [Bacillota bacterium]
MLRINNIKLKPGEREDNLKEKAAKALRCRLSDIIDIKIRKKSLDARKKQDIAWIYALDVSVKGESAVLRRAKGAFRTQEKSYSLPKAYPELKYPPVIVGFGPCGMFAGLILAQKGLCPIILERGKCAEERMKDIEKLRSEGVLAEDSNILFGEGGAGTFSDGKLTTRIKDIRCGYVLEELINAGAPPEIAYLAKPHLGTDKLPGIVERIRGKIISLGGEIRFGAGLTDIRYKNGRVCAAEING